VSGIHKLTSFASYDMNHFSNKCLVYVRISQPRWYLGIV
jgi:hypothetical protein